MAKKIKPSNELQVSAEKSSADFPKHPLEEALQIANTLEDKNGGNPLSPTDIAIALNWSPQSSGYRILLSSSIKYGLTSGSYNQPKISLLELGKNIEEPRSDNERKKSLIQAALRPDLFRRVYDFYKNKKLPDVAFFKTVLTRDFGVVRDQVDRCAEIFLKNIEFVGLVKQATTGKWLATLDDPSILSPAKQPSSVDESEEEEVGETGLAQQPTPQQKHDEVLTKSAIFLGHGKNKVPLQQLEKILTEYKIPHKVAIDEPNVGRPISQKVADIMKECGAAIIIFTADQEFKDLDGNTIFRPSENAIFELGASSTLYGSRIVIFRESSVNFPTNFRDIGHIEFEKDKLDAKVNELFRELIGFGLIKVTVGS
jgi:predicted nucleotide-binding protein